MNIELFDYDYPREQIATEPKAQRDQSRLLILDRKTGERSHEKFSDVLKHLNSGDCLAVNDTRVLPARLEGTKQGTGGRAEILLSKRKNIHQWEALIRPSRIKEGSVIEFGEPQYTARVEGRVNGNGSWWVTLSDALSKDLLDKGNIPLPPYMKRVAQDADSEWYQTVYAKNMGSIAAPTAGLHFTDELMKKLKEKGIKLVKLTLSGQSGSGENVIIKKDGTRIKVLVSASSMKDSSGKITGGFAVIKNITKEKNIEKALEATTDIINSIIVQINKDGNVQLINQKGAEILGYQTPAQIVGKNWFENFLPKSIKAKVKKLSDQMLKGNVAINKGFENYVLTKSGKKLMVAWHGEVIKDTKGNIVGHLSAGKIKNDQSSKILR